MFRAVYTSCAFLCLFLLAWTPALSGDDSYQADSCGSIRGRVIDAVSGSPVAGARLEVEGSGLGTFADSFGRFMMAKVPAGNHGLTVRSVGFERGTISAVVFPGKAAAVTVFLQPQPINLGTTTVRGTYAAPVPIAPGALEFSSEELTQSAGPAGDISRIVSIHPGVAKVTDLFNGLAVRGGTPIENGFYLDDIEIPNINHFPSCGSTGGTIGLLDVEFLREVNFSAGGFPAAYGDRLSSITSLTFREGNRGEFDARVDASPIGLGAAAEGPAGHRGSWFFSTRHWFIDVLADLIELGIATRFSDYQGKILYDVSRGDRVSVLGVGGKDRARLDKEQAIKHGSPVYYLYGGHEYAVGAVWRHQWGETAELNTSLAVLETKLDHRFFDTDNDREYISTASRERTYQFRTVTFTRLSDLSDLRFGVEGKYGHAAFNIDNDRLFDHLGGVLPATTLIETVRSAKLGGFCEISLRPVSGVEAVFGTRYDHCDYNRHSHLSPRFLISVRPTRNTTVNAAVGLYYQNLPLFILAYREANRRLNDPVARHYILGIKYRLVEHTDLSVEGYVKDYRKFPVSPSYSSLFIIDEMTQSEYFGDFDNLVAEGKAHTYGVDVIFQKRLVRGFYGIISGSWSRSRYLAMDDTWRDRICDNRVVVGIEGGYQRKDAWDFNLRWIFAGGTPYTPLNITMSRRFNEDIRDFNRINEERYPDYHVLNVQVERRFKISGSHLILYLAVWNVYNRKNVHEYYWNELERRQDVLPQVGILPLIGLKLYL